ncbi:Metallopeptidase family M24 [Rhizoctonia solani]|uniref:Metallopeptidase family M24 n=1 Tax=Rhizoctonia solani TaxID=456999 RepID=A0A8H8ST54_9AGAM|nr:Metallopeptidase family M24 [Rhizoctonia solani]QRW15927.1 Metallopeptidase family M24 [Rhizoctonia solani]
MPGLVAKAKPLMSGDATDQLPITSAFPPARDRLMHIINARPRRHHRDKIRMTSIQPFHSFGLRVPFASWQIMGYNRLIYGSSIEYHVPVTPYPLVLLASSPAERSQQRWNPENRISSTLSPTAELEVAPPSITSLRGAQHTPGSTTPRAFTAEIRCSDLWHEAYSIKDGCSFVQYVDGPEYHISCLGCGREFAKRYLRQAEDKDYDLTGLMIHRYPGRDSRRTAMTMRFMRSCVGVVLKLHMVPVRWQPCTIVISIYPS